MVGCPPFEAWNNSRAKKVRCLDLPESSLPLSCLIFDHRLCPDNKSEDIEKRRKVDAVSAPLHSRTAAAV